jgi:DNA-directed RNA polymerase subunit E'/Rpb7
MYNIVYLDERVSLTPAELDIITSTNDINDILTTKLRELHEKKCNANGYVRPGSIKLIGRSMGVSENGRFTGNYIYDCKFSCEILYPTAGTILDTQIIKVNKMGAYAVFEEAMRILLPRDTHVGNTDFDEIKEWQTVRVVIDRSRFQTKDTFIMAVGRLVSTSASASATNASPSATNASPSPNLGNDNYNISTNVVNEGEEADEDEEEVAENNE